MVGFTNAILLITLQFFKWKRKDYWKYEKLQTAVIAILQWFKVDFLHYAKLKTVIGVRVVRKLCTCSSSCHKTFMCALYKNNANYLIRYHRSWPLHLFSWKSGYVLKTYSWRKIKIVSLWIFPPLVKNWKFCIHLHVSNNGYR